MKHLKNQRGTGVVEVAAWIIVVSFLGASFLVGAAIMTPKTSLDKYKAVHEKPPAYDKMTPEQKRIYWEKYFQKKDAKGG